MAHRQFNKAADGFCSYMLVSISRKKAGKTKRLPVTPGSERPLAAGGNKSNQQLVSGDAFIRRSVAVSEPTKAAQNMDVSLCTRHRNKGLNSACEADVSDQDSDGKRRIKG